MRQLLPYFPLLLLFIGMLYWCTPISAHDAFYPHHREDFENMTRRRELRGTVILSTIAFVSVVGTIIYMALRKSSTDDKTDQMEAKTVQERLEHAANNAAKAARYALNTNSTIEGTVVTALTSYAATSGVAWRPRSYGRNSAELIPYQIRCKIGHDVVTLSINTDTIQVKADHYFSKTGLGAQDGLKGVSATATLKIKGEEEG